MDTIMEVVETYLKRNNNLKIHYDAIVSPSEAAKVFRNAFGDNSQECLGVLCLDTKNNPTHFSIVFKGTSKTIYVSSKDILKVALLSNATSIIIGHNHPSTDLTPSSDDLITTSNISKACKSVDIRLIDHLIINSEGDYYSIRENHQSRFN